MHTPLLAAAALARAALELKDPQDLDSTLDSIVRVARDSTPGIDYVGVSLVHRDGRIETRAASDEIVVRLDRAQYDVGEGPCLQAMDEQGAVRVENARHEQRWPRFIPVAVRMGLRAQLSICFHADGTTRGALNLYSFCSDTVSEEAAQLADLFASHTAMVLGHARSLENLNVALTSRQVIGMALGMVMARMDIDEATAFAYLTRVSASTETKLRDVATSVVEEHGRRLADSAAADLP